MKINALTVSIIKKDIKNGIIPIFVGDTGIGKTSLAEMLAEDPETGGAAFVLQANLLSTKEDITGARTITDVETGVTAQFFFPHQEISEAIIYATENPDKIAYLILDEINRTDSDVTSGMLAIPTQRKIGSARFPDNLRVIATGNDSGNISELDDASMTRFCRYYLEPDAETLIIWFDAREAAGKNGLHWAIREVLEERPDLVFCRSTPASLNAITSTQFADRSPMEQLTCPRTLHRLSDWLLDCDDTELRTYAYAASELRGGTTTLLREKVEGQIGTTEFAELLLDKLLAYVSGAGTQTTGQGAQMPVTTALASSIAAAASLSDITTLTASASNDEANEALVYLLTQNLWVSPAQKSRLRTMVENIASPTADAYQQILSLASTGLIDSTAMAVLKDTKNPAFAQLASHLSAM